MRRVKGRDGRDGNATTEGGGRFVGKLLGRGAGAAKQPGSLPERFLVAGTLRAPTLQRVDIGARRRAGFQPNNPVKRLVQQRIGPGSAGRLGHDGLLITLLAKPQPPNRVEHIAKVAI
ncbi:hypothetical protein ACVWY2_007197 [Bradyrhizobium sp. JR6.1]